MIDLGEGRFSFGHDLVAAALYNDVAPAQRQLLPARAFSYLAGRGDLGLAAPHALVNDLIDNDQAVAVLVEAGSRAIADGDLGEGTDRRSAVPRC